MIFPKVIEWDNFLTDQELASVLTEAHSLTYNVKGVYQGFASNVPASHEVVSMIIDKFTYKMGVYSYWTRPFTYRLSLQGEEPGVYNGIHNDVDDSLTDRYMVSMILYLQGIREDETMNFYSSEALGSYSFQPTHVSSIGSIKDQWKPYRSVKLRANKMIVFSSALYHGVSHNEGIGTTVEEGRLILPLFFHIGFNERVHDEPEPDILTI